MQSINRAPVRAFEERLMRVAIMIAVASGLQLGMANAGAAQTVRGTVLELSGQRPVADASVTLLPDQGAAPGTGAKTNGNGGFTLRSPTAGAYRLRIDKPGYRVAVTPSMMLTGGDTVSFVLRLLPDTTTLRPVVVTSTTRKPTGKLGGFYDRMTRYPNGHFITKDQIAKRKPVVVTDLLRTAVGLSVTQRGAGYDVRTLAGCTPTVLLDGLPFSLQRESLDDIVSPNEIEGIEIYGSPAVITKELQWSRPSCGVIAIWTSP